MGSVSKERPPHMLGHLVRDAEAAGLLWGVQKGPKSGDDGLRGYLAAREVEGYLHLEEIAVDRRRRRRRLGTALVGALQDECIGRGLSAVTLTTDRLLPSNIGFFDSLGFTPTDRASCPAHVQCALAAEREIFADPARRIAMLWAPRRSTESTTRPE